jgi:hypothetical protein
LSLKGVKRGLPYTGQSPAAVRIDAPAALEWYVVMNPFGEAIRMTEDQIIANIMVATDYLVSLLKKQWQSIGLLGLHSTMGGGGLHAIY